MFRRHLVRGAALALIGAAAAGCSSDNMARFSADDFTTASVKPAPQRVVQNTNINGPIAADTGYEAPMAGTSGGISRSSLPPPSAGGLAMSSRASGAVARIDDVGTSARRTIDAAPRNAMDTATNSVTNRATAVRTAAIDPLSRAEERAINASPSRVATADPAGWSSAGGTQITAKQGETVFNLARRYGVPSAVLMKVNGLDSSGELRAGQKIIVPTYVYSDRAPVSAPDHDPKVAASKSSRGLKGEGDQLTPGQRLAMSPQTVPNPVAIPRKAGTYVVASGDTMIGVAKRNGVTSAQLRAANGFDESDQLKIGQKIKIPAAGAAVAAAELKKDSKSASSLSKKDAETRLKVAAAKPAGKAATVAEGKVSKPTAVASLKPPAKDDVDPVETASTPAPAKEKLALAATAAQSSVSAQPASVSASAANDDDGATGNDRMRWPVKGRVAKSRDGIDIAVPQGTPVKAAENGVVIYAGDGLKDFGNTVLVKHDDGLVTVYGYADQINVKRGQRVTRGEAIATSGMSGNADSPKLHFEVRKNSSPVDPSTYLN